MPFLVKQVAFDHFYNPSAYGYKRTIFSDRNLVNRRNVVTEVKSKNIACKSFIDLELDARVIAATLHEMNLKGVGDIPIDGTIPDGLTNAKPKGKRNFVYTLAGTIVDEFIFHDEKFSKMLKQLNKEEGKKAEQEHLLTEDGRYRCRWPECNRTYAFIGKSKSDHEL